MACKIIVSIVEIKDSPVENLIPLIRWILAVDWCLCGAVKISTGGQECWDALKISNKIRPTVEGVSKIDRKQRKNSRVFLSSKS